MSFPTPQSMTYSVAPNPLQELGQAVHDAPLANAQQKQQLTEAQEGAAAAGARQAQDEIAKSQAQDQALARYASIPGIEKSPQGQKMLAERFKTLGIPMPTNEAGLPDMAAIRAIIQPPVKPWNQWSPEEVSKEMALDPSLRNLPADAPEMARTKAANVPISEAGYKAIMAPVQRAEEMIGKGTGNFQGLQGAALSAYKTLVARGADTSPVEPYLNADHTGLSDEYKNQMAGTLVDAQIDKLHKLGIFQQDEIKLRQEMIDQKKYEWDHPSAYQKGMLNVQDRRLAQQAQQTNARLSIMQQNLQARWTSIANARDNLALRSTAFGMNAYSRMIQVAGGELSKARSQLTSTTAVINAMVQNPQMRKSPQFQNLVDQANALQDFITTNGATLDQEQQQATQGLAGMYSQVTGQPSTVANPPPRIDINVTVPGQQQTTKTPQVGRQAVPAGAKPVATLKGKPIFLNAAGTGYVYQDGSEAK